MLGNLLSEIRRRHLWPIALVALLVAVAAPLLFLKSSPPDAPAASAAAPAAAAEGALPARAQRLLATSDAAATSSSVRKQTKASDPFEAPGAGGAAARDDASPASSGSSGSGSGQATTGQPAATDPIPVVITNSDGSKPTTTSPQTPPTGGGTTSTTTTTPAPTGAMLVDVRFGERIPARLHRAIPRLQTFVAGGRIVAIFVKYSPNRDKAVFAIAPSTVVQGDIECRRKEGVCRYVDIPAGKGVRLTTLAADNTTVVTRRLDVVRIGRATQTGATAAASSAPDDGRCLLDKMLVLTAADSPLASDACPS